MMIVQRIAHPKSGDFHHDERIAEGSSRSSDCRRQAGALDDIGHKWSKFSKYDLSALKSNDDLVTQVVAKYGLEKAAAQRDVDAVMKGRKI